MPTRLVLAALVALALALVIVLVPGERDLRALSTDEGGSPPAEEAAPRQQTLAPPAPREGAVRTEATDPAGTEGAARAARDPAANASATLVVRMVDKDRIPVAGALVSAWHREARGLRVTGEDGRARLQVSPGIQVLVRVSAKEGGVQESLEVAPLRPGETREVTIVASGLQTWTLYGRVLAAEDDTPIAGAELRLQTGKWFVRSRARPLDVSGSPSAVSDARGELAFVLESWKPVAALVVAEGRGPVRVMLDRAYGSLDRRLEVRLARAGRVVGRIFGAQEDCEVRLETEGYRLQSSRVSFVGSSNPRWSAKVQPDGGFELGDLPPNIPLRASVHAAGETLLRDPTPILLEPGETRRVEWSVGAGGTLSGVALDASGQPVPDLEIWLLPASEVSGYIEPYKDPGQKTRTDAAGRFVFVDLTSGDWAVGPRPERGASAPDAIAPAVEHVAVDSGAEVDIVLRIHRGLFIAGTVLDAAGAPAGGIGVNALGLDRVGWAHATAKGDGTFSIGPLTAGRYRVSAGTFGRVKDARSKPVDSSAGDDGIVLRLTLGGVLTGRVVDAETGEPLVARVGLHGARALPPGAIGFTSTSSSVSKGFELGGLPPATYDLSATTEDGRVGGLRGVEVTAGATLENLSILVRRGGRLRVRYKGPIQYASYRVLVDGAPVAFSSLGSGTEEVQVVPVGAATVHLFAYDRASTSIPPVMAFERELEVFVALQGQVDAVFAIE